jgi:glycerophosphoryl diester phosphodiesterase
MRLIAHRGASGLAPENTLRAFAAALELGALSFEFDVHRAKDGVLVVHHDFDLRRTAGRPERIAELTADELAAADVSGKFRAETGFCGVPRLSEVTALLEGPAEFINFELKNEGGAYPGIEEQLLDELKVRPALKAKAVVSCFDHAVLLRLRALDPELRLAFLAWNLSGAKLGAALTRAAEAGAEAFNPNLEMTSGENLRLMQDSGLPLLVYTVNDRKDALRLRREGAAGIFTNYPRLLDGAESA